MEELSEQEKLINYETLNHIRTVVYYLSKIQIELSKRIVFHDDTKLRNPELDSFVEFTPKLKNTTYGSEEYKGFLEEMKPALDHHYSKHRHHPEHFENGIDDMTLIDLIEMLFDWKAATLRHADGSMENSFKVNAERFKISDQLLKILDNTIKYVEQV